MPRRVSRDANVNAIHIPRRITQVESLEPRTLLSGGGHRAVSASLDEVSGLLDVTGTRKPDKIRIGGGPSATVDVRAAGAAFGSFPADEVRQTRGTGRGG